MSKSSIQTNLVGRLVLLDYPSWWKGGKPEFQEQLKEDAAKRGHYFGQHAEIVAVYLDAEKSPKYELKLEDGTLFSSYSHAFTVLETLEDVKKRWLRKNEHLNNAEAVTCFAMFLQSKHGMDVAGEAQEFVAINRLGELRSGWANQCEFNEAK